MMLGQTIQKAFAWGALWLLAATARGDFATIINVPPDYVGSGIGSNAQLNLFNGGYLYSPLWIGKQYGNTNTEMNIYGGTVVYGLEIESQSVLNMFAGAVNGGITARQNSTVNITGGSLPNYFNADFLSNINISGGEYLIDGVPIDDLQTIGANAQIDPPYGAMLSGTLADGTPFLFDKGHGFTSGTLHLHAVALPPIGATQLHTSTDPLPMGLRSGQTLTVDADASAEHHFIAGPGATVNLVSGNLSLSGGNGDLIALGATINVTGGNHDSNLRSLSGGVINVTGGTARNVTAGPNGTVNVTGGATNFGNVNADGGVATATNLEIEGGVYATNGGTVNFINSSSWSRSGVSSGGTLNLSGGELNDLRIDDGHVNISSGSIYYVSCGNGSDLQISGHSEFDRMEAYNGSTITLIGDEFSINGQPVTGLAAIGDTVDVQVPNGSVISGTYADGVPFALTPDGENSIAAATVRVRRAALPAIGPAAVNAATGVVPAGIRNGQTLTVGPDGIVRSHFEAGAGSTVNVLPGGKVCDHANVMGATMNIYGGQVGYGLKSGAGGSINVSGDAVVEGLTVVNAGAAQQSGGTISWLYVASGGTFSSSGGTIEERANVYGGTANLSGGTVKTPLDIELGGTVNASGATFKSTVSASYGGTLNFTAGDALSNVSAYGQGTVNVSGGIIEGDLYAYGVVNITGGNPAGEVHARNGSVVNISGGVTGGTPWTLALDAENGGTVRASGGVQADRFKSQTGSKITLVGGSFKLNGQPVGGLTNVGDKVNLNLGTQSVLTGIYADGTPFAFTTNTAAMDYDIFANGTLTLEAAAVPSPVPAQLNAAVDSVPLGIRQGQSLTVGPGGTVGAHFMAGEGSTVHVHAGGTIADDFEAIGATVNIDGGTIGKKFDAFNGSVVNISSGSIDKEFQAHAGSTINVSGGRVGTADPEYSSQALAGSVTNISGGELRNVNFGSGTVVNMTGGLVGDYFGAASGSTVRISGGTIGDHFGTATGGHLTLVGNDFRINGQPIPGLNHISDSVPLNFDLEVVTGVLADGTPIVFSHWDSDYINPNTLTLEAAAVPAVMPRNWLASADALPHGIRQGEVLTVDAGGTTGDDFNAGRGSIVHLQPGGRIGYNFEAIGATVNINGGDIDSLFTAFEGSVVNVRGGTFENSLSAVENSVVNVFAGSPSLAIGAGENSVINLFGGSAARGVSVSYGAALNVYGGSIAGPLSVYNGCSLNVFGTDFAINGVPIGQLVAGQPFTIMDRNVTLSGLLPTGEAFSLFLNHVADYFAPLNFYDGSRVTITTLNAGDFNADGVVDSSDYIVWRKNAGSANPNLAADGNFDGLVDQIDYQVWRSHLGRHYAVGTGATTSAVIPEPNTPALGLAGAMALACVRRRAKRL